jgi:hypothetical protein
MIKKLIISAMLKKEYVETLLHLRSKVENNIWPKISSTYLHNAIKGNK